MTSQDLLIDAFGRIKEIVHETVEGLGKEELASMPNEKGNSIAWLIWHLSRVQDSHFAELIGKEQVWLRDGWQENFKLSLDPNDTGYGHSIEQVRMVVSDEKSLIGYHDAVYKETIAFLKSLNDQDLEKVVDRNWDPPVTMAVRLISVISDDLQHAGQAAYVRGLIA